MHAHDRTMLAKLGFADPDKRNSRHDLACQYIGQEATAQKIARLLNLEHGMLPYRHCNGKCELIGLSESEVMERFVAFEHPIEKGSGQYKTTIGFIDVVLSFFIQDHDLDYRERNRGNPMDEWGEWQKHSGGRYQHTVNVGVEVKIKPVSIGDVIRQIKLYRSYTDSSTSGIRRWILATAYRLPQIDLDSLTNEKIVHVCLGSDFDEFIAGQESVGFDAPNTEI